MTYYQMLLSKYINGEGGGGGGEDYKGKYDVIPSFIVQTLLTKNKHMTANVRVEKIPVQKVENLGGGYTVTIGGN